MWYPQHLHWGQKISFMGLDWGITSMLQIFVWRGILLPGKRTSYIYFIDSERSDIALRKNNNLSKSWVCWSQITHSRQYSKDRLLTLDLISNELQKPYIKWQSLLSCINLISQYLRYETLMKLMPSTVDHYECFACNAIYWGQYLRTPPPNSSRKKQHFNGIGNVYHVNGISIWSMRLEHWCMHDTLWVHVC